MKKLIKGLHKFQSEVFPIQKNFFEELAQGQNPDFLFISCSDSRINPHLVTSADPGDLFILRNAGNIIPKYGKEQGLAATIEFAISMLGVKDIIVCGHSHCGAVGAVFEREKLKDLPNVQAWVEENIVPTLKMVEENYPNLDRESLLNVLLQEHVLAQVENLKTYPIVANAIKNQSLDLHAWIYTFETGNIFSFNLQTGQFELITHKN